MHRQPNGKYRAAARSLAFPKLSMVELNRLIAMASETSQDMAVLAFWDWLQTDK